jgi:hypothetical protein
LAQVVVAPRKPLVVMVAVVDGVHLVELAEAPLV